MRMNRKLVIGGVLALALGVAIGGVLWNRTHQAPAELMLYGNVDVRQVDLGFRVGGRIAKLTVDEGMRVPAGAELGRLDSRPLETALAIQTAQLGLARANAAKFAAGPRPQEVEQARQALAVQQARTDQAEAEYARAKGLAPSGAVSQRQLETAKADLNAARAQLDSARAAYDLQHSGYRHEDIDVANAQTQSAAATGRKSAIDLDDTILHAPEGGVVLTRAREPGAIVQPGETIFTLTIDRPMRVRAYIAQGALARISPGMAVTVTADGNPRTYHGTIGFISPTAEFTPKSVQTESLRADLVYRLRINVTDPDDALRQGQPVSVAVPGARPEPR